MDLEFNSMFSQKRDQTISKNFELNDDFEEFDLQNTSKHNETI